MRYKSRTPSKSKSSVTLGHARKRARSWSPPVQQPAAGPALQPAAEPTPQPAAGPNSHPAAGPTLQPTTGPVPQPAPPAKKRKSNSKSSSLQLFSRQLLIIVAIQTDRYRKSN